VAMAVRTWCVLAPRPAFAYHSLALVAHGLGRAGVNVIADARRDSWHFCSPGGALRRVATADLDGDLAMPAGFRHWTPLPPGVEAVPYKVSDLMAKSPDAELFRETAAPDAFLHEEPSYVRWTPQVHRAP
jgi:tRNA threonylcarbamoyladenosine biosynthesis protein TsaB